MYVECVCGLTCPVLKRHLHPHLLNYSSKFYTSRRVKK